MNKQQIQQQVVDRIYENTNNEISGIILQRILLNILTLTSDGFYFGGIVNTESYPLSDTNVFYIFKESGFFEHFDLVVDDTAIKIGLITYDSTQEKYVYEALLTGNYVRSISIGETITTEPGSMAVVTNTGTGEDVILNFFIPRGDQGEQGVSPFKGWFEELSRLLEVYPSPTVGDYAYVHDPRPSTATSIYECVTDGIWSDSGDDVNISIDWEEI